MTGEPPVRYHVSRDRRTVYSVDKHGTMRKLNITADELDRQMQLALQHKQDYSPDLDKPTTPRTIVPR